MKSDWQLLIKMSTTISNDPAHDLESGICQIDPAWGILLSVWLISYHTRMAILAMILTDLSAGFNGRPQ